MKSTKLFKKLARVLEGWKMKDTMDDLFKAQSHAEMRQKLEVNNVLVRAVFNRCRQAGILDHATQDRIAMFCLARHCDQVTDMAVKAVQYRTAITPIEIHEPLPPKKDSKDDEPQAQ